MRYVTARNKACVYTRVKAGGTADLFALRVEKARGAFFFANRKRKIPLNKVVKNIGG